jgi:hypothetical protein
VRYIRRAAFRSFALLPSPAQMDENLSLSASNDRPRFPSDGSSAVMAEVASCVPDAPRKVLDDRNGDSQL